MEEAPLPNKQPHSLNIRVRYAETDRMGVVHHSSYMLYLEEARTAMLRDLGYSYKEMEDSGIILPVYDVQLRFFKPAYYDDVLTIETNLEKISGVRITFAYQIFNQHRELLVQARVTLIFTDAVKFKPIRPPEDLVKLMSG